VRIAYFDCFSGIAGDMALGALLDAGLDMAVLSKELKKLNLKGYELKRSKVRRGELVGTKFDCLVKGCQDKHAHRSLNEILKLIDESSLNNRVKETAKNIFNAIGRVEGKIHGAQDKKDLHLDGKGNYIRLPILDPSPAKAGSGSRKIYQKPMPAGQIFLDELGDIDSIIDIVGMAIAVDELGIDKIYSSPINFGRTIINTRGGALPTPSPASLELLKGAPIRISDIEAELVTPTGAGILNALSKGFGEMPQMKVSDIGYGAGAKELNEIPNMLRVIIGERKRAFKEDKILIIETNIDDMNPQNFEYTLEKLFKEGALDAYTESIQMKKARPAFKLTVLCDEAKLEEMCSIIFSETTSIGIRYHESNRFKLDRKIVKVNTQYGAIKVKLSTGPDNILTVAPEYEECARIARAKKVPLKRVYEEAKKAVEV